MKINHNKWTRLHDLAALTGKTVAASVEEGNQLVIVLEGHYYLAINWEGGWEGSDGQYVFNQNIDPDLLKVNNEELKLIDEEDYLAQLREEEELERQREAKRKNNEYQYYLKLKAEFDPD